VGFSGRGGGIFVHAGRGGLGVLRVSQASDYVGQAMITISITMAAYEAIKATLPPGSDAWPAESDGRGGVRLTLDHKTIDRLTAFRGAGESYSDVILRWAGG
jgi:hypothetical protein